MQSQSDFTPKKVSDKFNLLLIEFNEAFNNCTENQTDDDYSLLIRNAGKYFTYVDLSLEFLNYFLDITYLIYGDNQLICDENLRGKRLTENVKEQILSFKRKVTPGVEKLRDKLENIDSELFNNVIPSFRSKCIELNYLEIPRSELVYKLFQTIQKENESTYLRLKAWKEYEGISWPLKLVPNILLDKDLQQLFNYQISGEFSDVGELNSFEKIKKHPYGFDRKKLVKDNLNIYDNINIFYKKLVPVYLLELAKPFKVTTQENPILILEKIVREFAKEKNFNISEIGLCRVYQNMLDLKPSLGFKDKDLINITSQGTNNQSKKPEVKAGSQYKYDRQYATEFDKDDNTRIKKFKHCVNNIKNLISRNQSCFDRNYYLFALSVIEAKNDDSITDKDRQYLNYIGQLYAFGMTRAEGKCIPTSIEFFDEKLELTTELKIFFGQTSWAKCLELVYSELVDTKKEKKAHESFIRLFDEFLECYSTSKTPFLKMLRSKIKEKLDKEEDSEKQEIKFRRGIYIQELLDLTQGYSQFNCNKLVIEELTTRVLLRLIILFVQSGKTKAFLDGLIRNAIKFEVACLSQEFFSGYFVNKAIADNEYKDLNSLVPSKWKKYQTDSISAFKVWLIFLIQKNILKPTNASLKSDVKEAFSNYINHKNRPGSATSLVKEHNADTSGDNEISEKSNRHSLVPIAKYNLSEGDINNAELLIYTNKYNFKKEESGDVAKSACTFVLTQPEDNIISDRVKTAKQVLDIAHIDIDLFNDSVDDNSLIKQWDQEFSVEGNEVLSYSYLKYLLEDCFGSRFGETKTIEENKPDFKNIIKSKNADSYFKKFNASTCVKLTFNYSDDVFGEKLNQKNYLLSQITNFNHERFFIKTNNDKAETLGQGAFGVVYHAEDTFLNSEVAIKLIPHWFRAKNVSNTLINEAASMRHCQHTNVTVVYDLIKLDPHNFEYKDERGLEEFDDDEFVYGVVMEYVNGLTLNKYIDSKTYQSMSFKQRLDLFIDICEGVNAIHEFDIVHGDIKPENILIIDVDGNPPAVKITDFGLSSKVGQSTSSKSNTAFSSINVLEGGALSKNDDIYSLGMILLYMAHPNIFDKFTGLSIQNQVLEKYELQFFINGVQADEEYLGGNSFAQINNSLWKNERKYAHLLQLYDCGLAVSGENHSNYVNYFFEIISECLSTGQTLTSGQIKHLVNSILNKKIDEKELENSFEYLMRVYNHSSDFSALKLICNISTLKEGSFDPHESDQIINTPTYLGRIITHSNMSRLSEKVNLSGLLEAIDEIIAFNNEKELHYSLLWREYSVPYPQKSLWLIQGKLYFTIINDPETFFLNVQELRRRELDLNRFDREKKDLYEAVYTIEHSESFKSYYFDKLLEYRAWGLGQASIPTRLSIQKHLREAQEIYLEVETLFLNADDSTVFTSHKNELQGLHNKGKEHLEGGLSENSNSKAIKVTVKSKTKETCLNENLYESNDSFDDPFVGGDSDIDDSFMEELFIDNTNAQFIPKYTGTSQNFYKEVQLNDILSQIDDSSFIFLIKEYINSELSKTFTSFYKHCFDYSKLRQLVIEWKNSDKSNSVDNFMSETRWIRKQYTSLEYKLYGMYESFDNTDSLTIVSR